MKKQLKQVHKELLEAMDEKTTTGNKARAEITYFKNGVEIGKAVLIWGEIGICWKY